MKIGILAGVVGLAVSAVAIAEAAKTADLIPISRTSTVDPEMQIMRKTGFPSQRMDLVGARRVSAEDGVKLNAVNGQSAAGVVTPRGMPNVVVIATDFENFPADVTLATPGITRAPSFTSGMLPANIGVNLRGQGSTAFVRVIDPVANPTTPAPAAGANGVANQTKMVRQRVAAAQAPDQFFLGHNVRTVTDTTEPLATQVAYPIAPTADNDARVSMEIYNTTTAELKTFEPVAAFTGFITGRILWGGTCSEATPGECTDVGLPIGPITTMVSLGPNPSSFTTGIFVPARFCQDAQGVTIPGCVPPAGFSIGQAVPIPLGAWHRMIGETSSDARVNVYIDYLDMNPEVAIYSNTILTSGFIDQVASNASFEAADAETFYDNVRWEGEPFALPTPPTLACPYLDDFEWLNTGPVLGQSPRIFAALSAALTVINEPLGGGVRGKVLSQTNNVSSDDKYRQESRQTLPNAYALPGDPWSFCLDARHTGATTRGYALDSEATNFIPGGVTARVFAGRFDPDTQTFSPNIFVQIRADYDPIDDPFGENPLDNEPIVGTDIADTGVPWTNNVYNELCMIVDVDSNLTVTFNGANIFTGTAFATAAALASYESMNNAFGSGANQRIDDIVFNCSALPTVTLPDFDLTYVDDFEWGIPGIPPVRHIDDPMGSPTASTRYGSANGVVMAETNLFRGTNIAVAMANVFRDTEQIAPPATPGAGDAFIFSQFTTEVPNVTIGSGDRWVIEAEFASNDWQTTSRGWSPLQASSAGGFFIGGYIWYAAPDDTFYLFGRDEFATMPGAEQFVSITGPTRASLGLLPGVAFDARVEYNLSTNKIDWFINDTLIGSTFPLLATNPADNTILTVRNLDGFVVWSGDDTTGAPVAPLSTLYLDNLVVSTGAVECPGDVSGDGVVNFADLNAVLATFGQMGMGLPADLNDDGVVNFADLNIVLSNFGNNCN